MPYEEKNKNQWRRFKAIASAISTKKKHTKKQQHRFVENVCVCEAAAELSDANFKAFNDDF